MKRWSKLTHCKQCSESLPGGRNVYCSDECFQASRRDQQTVKNEKHSVELTCDFCKGAFRRSKYRLNRSKGNFCDRSCASKFYKANGTYDAWTNSAKLNAEGDWVLCAGCGVKQVYRFPREIAESVQKCCARECFGKFISRTQSGENHPLWGTRMSEESKRKREQTWLARYGVTCGFMCGKNMSPSRGQLALLDELTKLDSTFVSEQLIKTDAGYYRVDALVPSTKLVVEYNGDWWHANPAVYGPDDMVGVDYGTRAQDVWERDSKRKAALERAGYKVLVVWELDWIQRRAAILESIKTELAKA